MSHLNPSTWWSAAKTAGAFLGLFSCEDGAHRFVIAWFKRWGQDRCESWAKSYVSKHNYCKHISFMWSQKAKKYGHGNHGNRKKFSHEETNHSGPQTIPFLVDPNGWWNLHLQWLDWHFSRTLIQTTRCSLPNNHDPGLFLLDRLFIDVPSSICPDVQGFQSMGSLLPLFFGNPMPSLWLNQFPSQEIHEEFTKHFTRHGQGMIYWVPQIPVTSQRGPNCQFLQMTPNFVGFILCSSASQFTSITIIGLQPGCLISCCFPWYPKKSHASKYPMICHGTYPLVN